MICRPLRLFNRGLREGELWQETKEEKKEAKTTTSPSKKALETPQKRCLERVLVGPRGGARGAALRRGELAGLLGLRQELRSARRLHFPLYRGALGGQPELLGRLAGQVEWE